MTGYLTRLAVRSTRTAGGLRPRTPSLFEAAPAGEDVTPPAARTPVASAAARPPERTERTKWTERTDGQVSRHPAAQSHRPPVVRGPTDVGVTAATGPVPLVGEPRSPASPSDAGAPPGPQPHPHPPAVSESPSADVRPVVASPRPELEQRAASRSVPAHAQHEPTPGPPDDAPASSGHALPTVPDHPRHGEVALPRLHPRPPSAQPAPEVKVSIGRIEVVNSPPATPTEAAPPTRPALPRRATGAPDLADYLRDRSRR